MGINAARIGDTGTGICCGHPPIPCISMTGQIISGSPTVFGEGINMSRIGDIVQGACGHTGTLISGSSTVFTNGITQCYIGSAFSGTFSGTIVSGASTVFIGG